MIQAELISPSMVSTLDQAILYDLDMDHEFPCSFINSEISFGIPSELQIQSMFLDELAHLPFFGDEMQFPSQMETIEHDIEGFNPISSHQSEDVCRWLEESGEKDNISSQQYVEQEAWSPSFSTKSSEVSVVLPSLHQPLSTPGIDMGIDNQLILQHLLKAYGEAIGMGQSELAEVIARCVMEKVSPVGPILERVAFNMFQSMEKQRDYLIQESIKNIETAFKVFYEIFLYGRFAHFTANSAILEAMPDDAETIHIVDFDMGEGVQWPPMIEAMRGQYKALRLTSIKPVDESFSASLPWRFEDIKKQLRGHARSVGLSFTVEEISLEDLVTEKKKLKKRGDREFLAFNCMVGLPHMGRSRSRSQVMEFLGVVKELLGNSAVNKGIIVFADGEMGETFKSSSGFDSFFEGCLNHYHALFESMEQNFPLSLAEARLTMESIFLAPYVSPLSWFNKWEEMKGDFDVQTKFGFSGVRLSTKSLLEAREFVKEGESSYRIRVNTQEQNEMVLEWRGTPLVRVSSWM